jgi:hypothetical protein
MKALCAEKASPPPGSNFLDAPLVMPVCAEPTEC